MMRGLLKKRLPILALTTMLYCACTANAYAAKNAKDIEASLSQKKVQQKELTKKSKELSSQVSNLQSKLVNTTKKLRDAERSLLTAEKNLKTLRNKRSNCLKQLYTGQSDIGGIASAARKYQSTPATIMFLYTSPIEAARTALVMKSIIPQLQSRSESLQKQLTELDKVEKEIISGLALQKESKGNLDKEQDKLSELLSDRKSIYQKTENDRKSQQAEMEKLAREAKTLSELISKIQPSRKPEKATPVIALQKAHENIPQPVNGSILTSFGQKDDMGSQSKGITFAARAGSTVTSPMAGTVKFAGPFKKFKQILIIEHKEGYHSLIAGLGRIDTVVGASLVAGEPVGVTEKDTSEPRIYYELLHNGAPINPKKNILAQRKQDKI